MDPVPSEEHPVYSVVPEHPLRPQGLCLIMWSEGWRTGVLCSSVRRAEADWLLGMIQGKPRPKTEPSTSTAERVTPQGGLL
jgi:hypothetical protein